MILNKKTWNTSLLSYGWWLIFSLLLLCHSLKGKDKFTKYEKLGKHWSYCTRNLVFFKFSKFFHFSTLFLIRYQQKHMCWNFHEKKIAALDFRRYHFATMILFNLIIVTSLWYQNCSRSILEPGILIKKLKNSNLWTFWYSVPVVNLVNEWQQYWWIFCNPWFKPWQILKLPHNSFICMICFFQSKFSDSIVWEIPDFAAVIF